MTKRSKRASPTRLRQLMAARPGDGDQLHRFIQRVVGLYVPRRPLMEGHDAPFAYLEHVFFEGGADPQRLDRPDCVVWANRGGGKTMLGAVATLLDLIFKPGIQVRILGGSLSQSSKMYEHLTAMFDRPLLQPTLATEPTQRRIVLTNGSCVEIIAQSQRAVRGQRVQKLRCDEVEQFGPDIWQAAQLITRSAWCGGVAVTGSVEALSTMHRPGGLMEQLIVGRPSEPNDATTLGEDDEANDAAAHRRLFKWNALDVVAQCEPARDCDTCVLWDDCGGRAKSGEGFMTVPDLVTQWHRTSADTWQAEMLCHRPKRADTVYPNFDLTRHVQSTVEPASESERPAAEDKMHAPVYVAGMDFGLRSPTVWLWAQLLAGANDTTVVHVVDGYEATDMTLERHLKAIERRAEAQGWPIGQALAWVGIDPAGRQRSSHTGLSDADVLKQHALTVRAQRAPMRDGIERIRRRLDRDTLLIHPRCTGLIEAMRTYHFSERSPLRNEPVKDGPDHACDALRYLVQNLELGPRPVRVRSWA